MNLYISISKILGDEERVIYHYHFLGWPDHGTPEDPGSVLNFLHDVKLKQVEKRQKQDNKDLEIKTMLWHIERFNGLF